MLAYTSLLSAKTTYLKWYSTQTTTDVDYADDIALLANTSTQDKSLLHNLERVAGGISHYVNADKIEYMCVYPSGEIYTLRGGSLKLVDKFNYHISSVLSTENDVNTWLARALAAINRLSVIWKADLMDKIKLSFFQAVVVSVLLYGYTT